MLHLQLFPQKQSLSDISSSLFVSSACTVSLPLNPSHCLLLSISLPSSLLPTIPSSSPSLPPSSFPWTLLYELCSLRASSKFLPFNGPLPSYNDHLSQLPAHLPCAPFQKSPRSLGLHMTVSILVFSSGAMAVSFCSVCCPWVRTAVASKFLAGSFCSSSLHINHWPGSC